MKMIFNKGRILSLVVLALSVVLIIFGVLQGDFFSVMGKAVFICLECIGIG